MVGWKSFTIFGKILARNKSQIDSRIPIKVLK